MAVQCPNGHTELAFQKGRPCKQLALDPDLKYRLQLIYFGPLLKFIHENLLWPTWIPIEGPAQDWVAVWAPIVCSVSIRWFLESPHNQDSIILGLTALFTSVG